MDTLRITAAVLSAVDASALPERVRLLPLGDIQAVDGRHWMLADAAAVIAASGGPSAELPIDLDHGADREGGSSEAAGWMTDLRIEDGHLTAAVQWTDLGRAKLAGRAYRYLSASFDAAKATGRVVRLRGAGLTNRPALPDLGALAAAQPGAPDVTDTIENVARALGLAETAAASEVATRATALLAEHGKVRESLALAADAGLDAVLAAIARRPSAEDHAQLTARLARIEGDRQAEKVTAAVEGAITAGKVTPAQREVATKYATADLAGFATFVAFQPVIVAPGARADLGRQPGKGDALDDVEAQVASAMRIAPADFAQARKEIEGAAR